MFNKLKKQGQKSNNNNAAAAQRQRFEDEGDEEWKQFYNLNSL